MVKAQAIRSFPSLSLSQLRELEPSMVNAKGMCHSHILMYLFVSNVLFAQIETTQREGVPSRDRRPSDKVAAQRKFILLLLKAWVNGTFFQVKPNERQQKRRLKKRTVVPCARKRLHKRPIS